jgi:hypothetical protein
MRTLTLFFLSFLETELFIVFVVVLGVLLIVIGSLKPKRSRTHGVPSVSKYGVASVTLKGENVKSIGERTIADYFENSNIKYVYEPEAKGKFLFFNYRIGYPDFYLPDYDVYVEYWGLIDADDSLTRARYVRNMKRKMAIYHQKGIKFISIYPRNLENLDWIFRTKFRKVTGYELPNSQKT